MPNFETNMKSKKAFKGFGHQEQEVKANIKPDIKPQLGKENLAMPSSDLTRSSNQSSSQKIQTQLIAKQQASQASQQKTNEQTSGQTSLQSNRQELPDEIKIKDYPDPKNIDDLMEQGRDIFLDKALASMVFNSVTAQTQFYRDFLKLKEEVMANDFYRTVGKEKAEKFFNIVENKHMVVADSNELVVAGYLTKILNTYQKSSSVNYYDQLEMLNKICDCLVNFIPFAGTCLFDVSKAINNLGKTKDFQFAQNILNFKKEIYENKIFKTQILESQLALHIFQKYTQKEITEIKDCFNRISSKNEPNQDIPKPESKQYFDAFYQRDKGDAEYNNVTTSQHILENAREIMTEQEVKEMVDRVYKNPAKFVEVAINISHQLLDKLPTNDFQVELDLLFEGFEDLKMKTGNDPKKPKIELQDAAKDFQRKQQKLQMYNNRIRLLNEPKWIENVKLMFKNDFPKLLKFFSDVEISTFIDDFEKVKNNKGSLVGLCQQSLNLIAVLQDNIKVLFVDTALASDGKIMVWANEELKFPNFMTTGILEALETRSQEAENASQKFVGRWQTVSITSEVEALLIKLPDAIKRKAITILDQIEQAGGFGNYQKGMSSRNYNKYGNKRFRSDVASLDVFEDDLEFDIGDKHRMFLRSNGGNCEVIWAGEPHSDYRKK